MINWRVRFKNPVFWSQVLMAALMPILAYMGLSAEDLSSWGKLGQVLLDAVLNPYIVAVVAVSVYNAVIDPTTAGLGDSKSALKYDKPKIEK